MFATLKVTNPLTRSFIACCLLTALLVGILIVEMPIVVFAVSLVSLLLAIAGMVKIEYFVCLILLTVIFAPEYIDAIPSDIMGIGGNSLHKLIIFLSLVPYIYIRRTRIQSIMPILTYFILVLLSFSLSSWYPGLDTLQPFKSFLGLTIGWFIYSLDWNFKLTDLFIRIISLIAILSFFAGSVLHILKIHDLYVYEWWNGAYRLQGAAGIPAYLAFLAFVSLAASIYQYLQNKRGYVVFIVINTALLLATATRGATLAAAIIFIPLGFRLLSNSFYKLNILQVVAVVCVLIAISSVALPNLLERNQNTFTKDLIDSSGRLDTWNYFIQVGMVNPWFGRGLGTGTIANSSAFSYTLTVPHNEYIRMFVDNGFVGVGLILLSMLLTFYKLLKQVQRSVKGYLIALLVALFVYSLFDNTFTTAQFSVPFFWLLALIRDNSVSVRYKVANTHFSPSPIRL